MLKKILHRKSSLFQYHFNFFRKIRIEASRKFLLPPWSNFKTISLFAQTLRERDIFYLEKRKGKRKITRKIFIRWREFNLSSHEIQRSAMPTYQLVFPRFAERKPEDGSLSCQDTRGGNDRSPWSRSHNRAWNLKCGISIMTGEIERFDSSKRVRTLTFSLPRNVVVDVRIKSNWLLTNEP